MRRTHLSIWAALLLAVALAVVLADLISGFFGEGAELNADWTGGMEAMNWLAVAGTLVVAFGLLMGVALFGFVIRLAAISAAVLLVADQSWVEPVPLGLTLVVTHLGLLLWETRFVSASLAFPGLKPTSQES